MIDQIFLSLNKNPYYNLALEDYFLRNKKFYDKVTLLLWSSTPSIVMGRFQNPWMECYLDRCLKDSLNIVRRQSGGGTVYIDEGNLNFSFIGKIKKEENFKFVKKTLSSLGTQVEVNDRNDILLSGKKISGSAFKNTKDSKMHHLSLLIETEPDKIPYYLFKENSKFESKSIPSKRSPVTKLNFSLEDLVQLLGPSPAPYKIGRDDFFKKMMDPDWIYGETPKFELKVGDVTFKSHKGKVTDVKPFKRDLIGLKLYDKNDLKVLKENGVFV